MKNKWTLIFAGALLAAVSGTAVARDRISFSLFFGTPGYAYVTPAPVYYYPPLPPVTYYAPPRVIYYAPSPVYYAPAPWAAKEHRHPGHLRGWHKHHR